MNIGRMMKREGRRATAALIRQTVKQEAAKAKKKQPEPDDPDYAAFKEQRRKEQQALNRNKFLLGLYNNLE